VIRYKSAPLYRFRLWAVFGKMHVSARSLTMLFYFYVLFVILLHLIPMGGYSLNTMEFGPFRADYLLHALVFFPWMFLCLLLPGSRSTEISIGTWLGWMIVGIAFAVAAEGVQYWLPRRIEAHVKICVLALLLERLAEICSGRTWPRIKQGLEVLQISYFSTAEHGFYRTNELTNDVKKILKSLRISPPKLVQGVEKHSKNV